MVGFSSNICGMIVKLKLMVKKDAKIFMGFNTVDIHAIYVGNKNHSGALS